MHTVLKLFQPFTTEGNNVLQKDGFFRKREEQRDNSLFRPSQPATPATVPAAYVAPPPLATEKGEERKEAKLIVGPDIKLKGAEITDCDTLVVEGRVEASMDSRVIQIAEHGVFVGKAGIDVAEIRGRFEGELTSRKQLVIRATGKVSGKVRYGKVAIEEGGEISGDI